MTRKLGLILAGILLYVSFTIAMLPARLVLPAMVPDTTTFDGIDGSVWSGTARSLSAGNIFASNVSWNFEFLRLFRMQAAYDLGLEIPGGFARGVVAASPGRISVYDARMTSPVAEIARLIAPMNLQGQASIEITQAQLVDGWPVTLDAVVRFGNVMLLRPVETDLGNFQVTFDPANATDAGLVGNVEDVDASIDLSRTLLLLSERGYQIDLRMLPEASEAARFERMLRLVPKDEEGRYQLSLAGEL